MKFTTQNVFSSVVFALLTMAWSTWAVPVAKRDVFNPPITHPKAGDVFTAGETILATWDTSSLPVGTPNKGMILLGFLDSSGSENLDINHPLASGFLLREGSHNITFPSNLSTKNNYIIVLFGDSGNISPKFTIKARY